MTDGEPPAPVGPVTPRENPTPSGFFRSLIESITDAIITVDASGTITYANPRVTEILGYPASDVVGQTLSAFLPDSAIKYRALIDGLTRGTGHPLHGSAVDVPVVHRDGDCRWVSISVDSYIDGEPDLLVGTIRDVTRRHEREMTLENYERIIETIDDGIYILDENFTITNVNEAVVEMTGYPRDELHGAHASLLASDETIARAAELSLELLQSDRTTATIVTELTTKNGGSLPIETRFTLYPFGDDRYGQLGVVRDITDRKQHEETLTALHNSTRDLLTVDTKRDISHLIVQTATDVLDLDGAAIYLIDPDENVLRPTASAAVTAGIDDKWPALTPTSDVPWRVFVEERTAKIDPADHNNTSSELPIDHGLCVPLGEHGVFVIATSDHNTIDSDKETLIGLLAASAEEALSRLDREYAIRERDRQLEDQNRRLRRLVKVNAIIRDIDQVLVEAESTNEIGEAVCDRLVASDRFAFAWIGRRQPSDGTIAPRAWAGTNPRYLDDVTFSLDDSCEPAVTALTANDVTVVSDVGADIRSQPWRKAALARNYRSVLSVPLRYGEITHGVLTVYANEPEAFAGMETVFAELGETIANAINAVETKRALYTDSRTELGFRIPGSDDVLQRFAQQAGGPIEIEDVVLSGEDDMRVFFTTPHIDPRDFRNQFEKAIDVDSVALIVERDDNCLFEAIVTGPSVLVTVVEQGAKLRSVTATAEEIHVDVEIPDEADLRGFVATVQSRFPGAELVSKTERDRPVLTPTEFHYKVEDRLTERQLEVLRIAYRRGFFEWPRENSGQDIADSLGISQPTVNRHLRACERKLFTLLFDGD